MIIQNFQETGKGKTFTEGTEIRKLKIHKKTVWLLIIFTVLLFTTEDMKKDKVPVLQWNKIISLYCTALGFISKNEECNPKCLMVGIWKTW